MSDAAAIWVTFRAEGLHCWPSATQRRAYLAHKHRHMFHVRVLTRVAHDDREIEFHDLRAHAQHTFQALGDGGDFGGQSCEALARRLAGYLALRYSRTFEVEVSEDGEFGACVTIEHG